MYMQNVCYRYVCTLAYVVANVSCYITHYVYTG